MTSPSTIAAATEGDSRGVEWRWDAVDYKDRRDVLKMAQCGKHVVMVPAKRGRETSDQVEILTQAVTRPQ